MIDKEASAALEGTIRHMLGRITPDGLKDAQISISVNVVVLTGSNVQLPAAAAPAVPDLHPDSPAPHTAPAETEQC